MGESCWNCTTARGSEEQYCGNCGAPQTEFSLTPSQGFLSDHSQMYLTAIADGDITRNDADLDPELVASLEEQLLADIEAGLVDFGLVLMTDSDALTEASGVLDRTPDADLEWEDLVYEIGVAGIAYLQMLQFGSSVIHELEARADGKSKGE